MVPDREKTITVLQESQTLVKTFEERTLEQAAEHEEAIKLLQTEVQSLRKTVAVLQEDQRISKQRADAQGAWIKSQEENLAKNAGHLVGQGKILVDQEAEIELLKQQVDYHRLPWWKALFALSWVLLAVTWIEWLVPRFMPC